MTNEQERAAFFAWVADCGCDTDGAWSAWQARAALASQVVQEPVAWQWRRKGLETKENDRGV